MWLSINSYGFFFGGNLADSNADVLTLRQTVAAMLGIQDTDPNYLDFITIPDTNPEYCNNYGWYYQCSYRLAIQVNVPISGSESAQSYYNRLSNTFWNNIYSGMGNNIFYSMRTAYRAFSSASVNFNPYSSYMTDMSISLVRPGYVNSKTSANWAIPDQILGTIFPSSAGHVLSVEAISDARMILVFLSSCHYVLLDANGIPEVYENSNDYYLRQSQRTCSQPPLVIPNTYCSCYWCECRNTFDLLYATDMGSITTITSFTSSSNSYSSTIRRAAGVQLARLGGTNDVVGFTEKGLIREIFWNRQSISLQGLQVESIQFTSTALSQAFATLRNGSVAYLELSWYYYWSDYSLPTAIPMNKNKTFPNLWTATVSLYFLNLPTPYHYQLFNILILYFFHIHE